MTANIRFTDTLYGRDIERKKLLHFLISAASGKSSVVFISGSPGNGKTLLAKSIINETQEAGGIFVTGKFDQYNNLPYSALTDGLRDIIKTLLLFKESKLKELKKSIIGSLSPNIRVISDIAPELEYITGKQLPPPDIDPGNIAARFKHCMSVFLSIVCSYIKPLVFFFDDIQWADAASIEMMRYFIETSGIKGLLLLLAYRDNEINIDHIFPRPGRAFILNIQPLTKKLTEKMIFSALECSSVKIKKAASVIYKKTSGNPFYIRRFLQTLISNGSLYKDENGRWLFNKQISAWLPVTENVAELIAKKIRQSLAEDVKILSVAACIGSKFNIEFLSIVAGMEKTGLVAVLRRFINEDYLDTDSKTQYVFVHDKVREAAYSLLSSKDKNDIHWKIGNILLKTWKPEEDNIFPAADHLNKSGNLPVKYRVTKKQININYKAGIKARASAAYSAAVLYFEKALLLTKNSHRNKIKLLFKIQKNYAECHYLKGDYSRAEFEIFETMKYTASALEIADLYNTIVLMKTIEGKYNEAIDYGNKALERIGFIIDKNPSAREKHAKQLDKKVALYLKDISIDKIINLPECKDKTIRCALTLLRNISSATYILGDQDWVNLIYIWTVHLTFENGVVPESCSGFICYALLLSISGNHNLAYIFGESALKLANKYKNLQELCFVSIHYANLIMYWKYHLKKLITFNKKGFEAGLKSGSYLFLSCIIALSVINMIFIGINIETALKNIDKGIEYLLKINDNNQNAILLAIQLFLKKISRTTYKSTFTIQEITEENFINSILKKKNYLALAVYYRTKMIHHSLFGDYNETLNYYELVKESEKYIRGNILNKECYFYYSLAKFFAYSSLSQKEQAACMEEFALIRAQFKKWSDQCPENFLSRHLLIEAENARIYGELTQAMYLYDEAINAARENEFKQIEAIACERAAIFWLSHGKKDFAGLYLKGAYTCFFDWGATEKLEALRSQYPDIFSEYPKELDKLNSKDWHFLLKAFNLMSVNSNLTDLLKEVTYLALEYSGAESFSMLIEHEGRLELQAYGNAGNKNVKVLQSKPIDEKTSDLPVEMIRYIRRIPDNIIIHDGYSDDIFSNIPYIKKTRPVSAVCLKAGTGNCSIIWYLENNLKLPFFKENRKTLLEILAEYAGIFIQNAINGKVYRDSKVKKEYSFKINKKNKNIPYKEIIYFSSHKRNSILHTIEKDYDIPALLKNIELDLPEDLFLRIHKQHIINTKFVSHLKRDKTGRYYIYLNDDDDTSLPIGRIYRTDVREKLKSLADI